MPNIENIKRSSALPVNIINKIVYTPSIPFEYSNNRKRDLPVITNFVSEAEPRRAGLMQKLRKICPNYRNIQGVYDLHGLRSLYSSAKLLVNPHQTCHHHSIEEFRVLPALSRGCIVISEDVPLRNFIPYHEYIIWCDYEEIADVTSMVLNDYDSYYDKIHGESSGLSRLLVTMKGNFEESLSTLLANGQHWSLASRLKRKLAHASSIFQH